MPNIETRWGLQLVLLGTLALRWGSSYLLMKIAVAEIPPTALIAVLGEGLALGSAVGMVALILGVAIINLRPVLAAKNAARANCGWLARRVQRRELLELDDRLLRDIGVTRADALREAKRLL